jgi:hypothetical protein
LSRELAATSDNRTIVRLAIKAVARFGGVNQLAVVWVEQIGRTIRDRPGSRAAVQAVHSLLMLMRASKDARKALAARMPRPDVDQLELDELQAELACLLGA